jgi:hypothetical protein
MVGLWILVKSSYFDNFRVWASLWASEYEVWSNLFRHNLIASRSDTWTTHMILSGSYSDWIIRLENSWVQLSMGNSESFFFLFLSSSSSSSSSIFFFFFKRIWDNGEGG